MTERERLSRSWIANAAAWRDAVREQRIESRRRVTNAAIVDAVLAQNPRTVLDVGCGEGWLARALAAHGIAVTGIDGSVALVEAAKELGGGNFLAISYEQIVADPAVIGSGFDAIVANFSLLDDAPEKILRALPATGTLIVQTIHPVFACGDAPYVDGWRTETFASVEGDWREPMPWYFRTLESWSRVFARAGYGITEIREPMDSEKGIPASMIFVCRKDE